MSKKFDPKKIILGVFTPRGSHLGYPGVPSTLKFQKKNVGKIFFCVCGFIIKNKKFGISTP